MGLSICSSSYFSPTIFKLGVSGARGVGRSSCRYSMEEQCGAAASLHLTTSSTKRVESEQDE